MNTAKIIEFIFYILVYGLTFTFGMCIFSFLNVLIYRLPKKISFAKGRSFCPGCNHELKALDLIPVFSYLFLGRKCRYCKTKISPRYMLVELLGGFAAIAVAIKYFELPHYLMHLHFHDDTWFALVRTVFVFMLFCLLTVVAFIDIDTQEISNGASIFAAILGALSIFVLTEVSGFEHLIGFFVISIPLLIITLIVPGAFGGGDIKLMFGLGGLLGWKLSIVAIFISIVAGGLVGVIGLITGKLKRKDHFAFGPFLCIGVVIALLFGKAIWNWYFRGLI